MLKNAPYSMNAGASKAKTSNIIWGDGNFDVPTVNLIIEDALDQEADVLLTLSLPIMQVAVNVTVDDGRPASRFVHIGISSRYPITSTVPS